MRNGFAHFALALERKNAQSFLLQRLGHWENLSVFFIKILGELSCKFNVRHLILAHRYLFRALDEDVRRHHYGIKKKQGIGGFRPCVVFELIF